MSRALPSRHHTLLKQSPSPPPPPPPPRVFPHPRTSEEDADAAAAPTEAPDAANSTASPSRARRDSTRACTANGTPRTDDSSLRASTEEEKTSAGLRSPECDLQVGYGDALAARLEAHTRQRADAICALRVRFDSVPPSTQGRHVAPQHKTRRQQHWHTVESGLDVFYEIDYLVEPPQCYRSIGPDARFYSVHWQRRLLAMVRERRADLEVRLVRPALPMRAMRRVASRLAACLENGGGGEKHAWHWSLEVRPARV